MDCRWFIGRTNSRFNNERTRFNMSETIGNENPKLGSPWLSPWPESKLESISACPVCGSAERKVLYKNLTDNVFFVAPGKWTLHRCIQCSSAYLSPRPTIETINLAYQNYYTHNQTKRLPPEDLHGLRWLQRLLANGYKNWRFRTNLQPSSILGVPVAFLMPTNRAKLNRQFRHLPQPPKGGCLLDVGFGDGSFLENAKSIGWHVVGVDSDIETVKNARQRGLNVHHGGLETLIEQSNNFDVITLSHVIEHMHDPIASLRACHRLLKPGGQIWLETPNIKSLGHAYFKENWRGLESPRHLVLFNSESLCKALVEIGFRGVKYTPQPSPCQGIYTLSQRIKEGKDPHIDSRIPITLSVEIAVAKFIARLFRSRREFIAMTALKKEN